MADLNFLDGDEYAELKKLNEEAVSSASRLHETAS